MGTGVLMVARCMMVEQMGARCRMEDGCMALSLTVPLLT